MRAPTTADVLEAVAYVTGVDPLTAGRAQEVMRSRRLACHALREITELSYPSVARALGYADHTSVIHQCRQPIDIGDLKDVLERVGGETGGEELPHSPHGIDCPCPQAYRIPAPPWQPLGA